MSSVMKTIIGLSMLGLAVQPKVSNLVPVLHPPFLSTLNNWSGIAKKNNPKKQTKKLTV